MSTGMPTPSTFAALSQSVFGAGAAAPQPQAPPVSALGGASPPAFAPPGLPQGGVPPQYPQTPVAPYQPSAGPQGGQVPQIPQPPVATQQYQQPYVAPAPPVAPPVAPEQPSIPPQYLQQPAQPQAPAIAPTRHIIDRLIAQGDLRAEDAIGMDDWSLFNYFLDERGQQPAQPQAPPAAPVAPATPVAPVAAPAAPTLSQTQVAAQALLQAGVITEAGGFYSATNQAFAPIVAQFNADRVKEMQEQAARQAQQALSPELQSLKQTVDQLQTQLRQSIPKPHEAWIKEHKSYLHVKDASGNVTPALSAAGQIYDRVWRDVQAKGMTDESVLHTAAAAAVEAYWRNAAPVPQVSQQSQPQQTFMQTVQNAPYAPTPGFNLPGQNLSAQNPQTVGPPRTPQGMPDWEYYRQQALSGTVPPV